MPKVRVKEIECNQLPESQVFKEIRWDQPDKIKKSGPAKRIGEK